MSDASTRVEDIAVGILGGFPQPLEASQIRETVESIQSLYGAKLGSLDDEELERVAKRIETRFNIRMGIGAVVQDATDYQEWLSGAKERIPEWFYWSRYRRYLETSRGFPPLVIADGLHPVSDRILGLLENPCKEGKWLRRGLVVGHVQSGKTANYTGVICKAADVGYRVIVVLAGIHNNLRNQTQERIEEGFVGADSSKLNSNVANIDKLCGVGELDSSRAPFPLTTRSQDFNAKKADQFFPIGGVREPVIFVIKKNVHTLKNLTSWLNNSNLAGDQLFNLPMLLIDDEADNASIDTSKDSDDATTINRSIRGLLNLFNRRCYIGYTATPFANIFIDPESEHEMYGDDLFPSDFIVSLDPPDNYVGANKLFGGGSEFNVVRSVDDYEDFLPLKHKKEIRPAELPPTLYRAIDVFLLSRAARLVREDKSQHNSMLVNVSRFTDVQGHIRSLIQLYLDQIQPSISNHYALPENDAMKNKYLQRLHTIWTEEFAESGIGWTEILLRLHAAVAPIRVIEVNASKRSESPVYGDYPDGLNVIAVGGFSLSRGLTLEGLSVSYFLRNSMMYDTLMQMGRWFGYRDDYEDLCRVFMPSSAIAWYEHITEATEELRNEFVRMQQMKLTPRDFGLAVRSHPESLIVTARNKIRTGTKVVRSISLNDKLIETTALYSDQQNIERNVRLLHRTVEALCEETRHNTIRGNYLWQGVPMRHVEKFVEGFQNHPLSIKTQNEPVANYLKHLVGTGTDSIDVVLVSVSKAISNAGSFLHINGIDCGMSGRKMDYKPAESCLKVSAKSARVGEREDESYGLSESVLEELREKWKELGASIPGKDYRERRSRPILIIRVLRPTEKFNGAEHLENGVVAYGLSFPPAYSDEGLPTVEYMVNTVWWNEAFGGEFDDEDGTLDE